MACTGCHTGIGLMCDRTSNKCVCKVNYLRNGSNCHNS